MRPCIFLAVARVRNLGADQKKSGDENRQTLKAMLHETIFLATRNAMMMNKTPLQSCKGYVTRWQLLSQLATCTITNKMADTLSCRKMSSDWPILTKLHCELKRGCHTQATCLATLRKVEGRSTFLTTRNATIIGVLHVNFFLATCNATFVEKQVARKIASCNMALTLRLLSLIKVTGVQTSGGKLCTPCIP